MQAAVVDPTIHFLGTEPPEIDVELAERYIRAFPHRTVVEMLPVPEKVGGLLMLSSMYLDVGVVLSAGDGVPLLPGDVVAVDHAHGKWLDGFRAGEYVATGQVRMYGFTLLTGQEKMGFVPYWKSILARVLFDSKTETPLRATGHNVIIDRGEIVEQTPSGIYLPESASHRESHGTVVSVGELCSSGVKEGMVVYYVSNKMKPCKGLFGLDSEGNRVPKNHGIIHEDGVLAEVLG